MSVRLKFVFIGNPNCGKTALNHKFITQRFENNQSSTIGAIFSFRQLNYTNISPTTQNLKVAINFWDTAGQERFRSIVPMYYRGSSAILLVFDLTNRSTFQSLIDYWSLQIKHENCIKVFLIGNKTDLNSRQVTTLEAQQFANQHGFDYYETSAKCDDLEPLLKTMVLSVCEKIDESHLPLDKLQFYGVQIDPIEPNWSWKSMGKSTWKGCCRIQ